MTDRFFNDVEIPDLPSNASIPNPDSGFIQLVGKGGKLVVMNSQGTEVIVEKQVQTQLMVDNGNASTQFQNYVLRLDFGNGGASINPTGAI